MIDWNGREVAAAPSRGGVIALADFSDNLIRPDSAVPWPPPAIVQRLYESRQARAFEGPDLAPVTGRLGIYSTFSRFTLRMRSPGATSTRLMIEAPTVRTDFLNWLVEHLGLPWSDNSACSIDLWRRIPHPNKSLPGGPELDFVLDGDRCVSSGRQSGARARGGGMASRATRVRSS